MVEQTHFAIRHDYFHSLPVVPAAPGPRRAHIVRISREGWRAGSWVFRPDHRVQTIFQVRSGRGRFSSDAHSWAIAPGSVFCYGPGHAHRIEVDRGGPMEIHAAVFAGSQAAKTMRRAVGSTCLAVDPRHPAHIRQLLESLYELVAAGDPQAEQACAHGFFLLVDLIASACTSHDRRDSGEQRRLRDCKRYIDQHFLAIAQVGEVAAACGITGVHLSRLFRRHLQTTPKRYLARLRMEHAIGLLTSTDRALGTIADELGFADAYSFSKAFKRHMGIAPSSLR